MILKDRPSGEDRRRNVHFFKRGTRRYAKQSTAPTRRDACAADTERNGCKSRTRHALHVKERSYPCGEIPKEKLNRSRCTSASWSSSCLVQKMQILSSDLSWKSRGTKEGYSRFVLLDTPRGKGGGRGAWVADAFRCFNGAGHPWTA